MNRIKIRFNAPFIEKLPNGERYYPSRFVLPAWVDYNIMTEGVDNLSFPSLNEFQIIQKSELPDFSGLRKSLRFPKVEPTLDFEKVLSFFRQEAPVDNKEIVEWMQESAAVNALLDQRMEEYNRYSNMVSASGDANIPGVYVDDIRFKRETGWTVYRRGYAYVYSPPVGTVRVDNRSGRTIIARNYLAWAGVRANNTYQWNGLLAKWRSLARTPIRSTIGFINFYGIIAPHFFVQEPSNRTESIESTIVISSSEEQEVTLTFRDPNDYTRVLDEAKINVGAGVYEIRYANASYPAVPPVVVEVQPQKPTALRSFTVETR